MFIRQYESIFGYEKTCSSTDLFPYSSSWFIEESERISFVGLYIFGNDDAHNGRRKFLRNRFDTCSEIFESSRIYFYIFFLSGNISVLSSYITESTEKYICKNSGKECAKYGQCKENMRVFHRFSGNI